MTQLTREDLMSLETYSEKRPEFRQQIIEHKKNRKVDVGPSICMHFEDRLVMQYQIQEMLRVERIFEAAAIQEELDTYNPLIPDGSNFKATQMIEFADPEIRKVELGKLVGVDRKTYVQVEGHDPVFAISDEDLERETEEKTSSVHFMRFELSAGMIDAAKSGSVITVGVDHENYKYSTVLNEGQQTSLVADLGTQH